MKNLKQLLENKFLVKKNIKDSKQYKLYQLIPSIGDDMCLVINNFKEYKEFEKYNTLYDFSECENIVKKFINNKPNDIILLCILNRVTINNFKVETNNTLMYLLTNNNKNAVLVTSDTKESLKDNYNYIETINAEDFNEDYWKTHKYTFSEG